MIQFLRLLNGYVHFSAEGGFPERFINLCKLKGISLWNVKIDGVKVKAFTTEREFEALNLPAENSGMTIRLIKKYGLKSFIKRHKWRCGVVLGILLSFLFWVYMSGGIWEIEIVETAGVNAEAFTESLAELGVKIGARKSDIDIIQVQNQLMNEYKQLLWVSLNIFGGKAQVEMSEFVESKEIIDTKKPVNLVALKKGEIVLVKGYKGVNMVKEGDNVTENTLLISGVIKNFDGSESFTHARGQVFAKTENIVKGNCKLTEPVLITCEKQTRYYIYAYSLKIPTGPKTEGDLLTEDRNLLRSGDTVLPLGIIREDNLKEKNKSVEFTVEQAALSALLETVKVKRDKYNQTDLKKIEYNSKEKGKNVTIKAKITCIEDIACEAPITAE